MPWPLFNRPSIQLGSLKSYLESNADWLKVDTEHPYLEIAATLGTELYHLICQNTWISEALYAPLVFPEQRSSCETLAANLAGKTGKEFEKIFSYGKIHTTISDKLQSWTSSLELSKHKIVGFSVCFHQLLASVAAAKLIKKNHPHISIVFGGSSCAGKTGRSLLKVFDCIDFVIQGEGEKSLLQLAEYLSGRRMKPPAGLLSSNEPADNSVAENFQLSSLKSLPTPDYDGYFAELQKHFKSNPIIPILPVEFSRGCWWNRCNFCNLNLQWCGYRFKKTTQVLSEVQKLANKYGCLDFSFTDNMLPPKESLKFFSQTGASSLDLNFFAEIRPTKEDSDINNYYLTCRRGGLSSIQVGIESLSNSLLKKMDKGTSVIDNIAAMRASLEYYIKLEGNLILQFPGSTSSEVDETLANLDYLLPFSPLNVAAFFLGYESPVYASPEKFGISAITNHRNNSRIFPHKTLKKLSLIVQGYRGDLTYQKKIWRPVAAKVKKWQKYHSQRKVSALEKPLLYYRDGKEFLIIRQEIIDGRIFHHRLKGTSRQIYLFCTEIRSDKELTDKFHGISEKEIKNFIEDLQNKRLLFSDKGKNLSLAVHRRGL
jgi:ribosomal peptide maturation radical SAM protein 1